MQRNAKPDLVQVRNPRSDRYIKIDRTRGLIIGYKKTPGPYKHVRVVEPRRA